MHPVKVVLIADDNADAVESMSMLLEFDGFTVLTALNGDKAFEIADRERPDAVVLDLGMPGRSGLEVARAIRHETSGASMRLIALTGWAEAEHDLALVNALNHVLIKPSKPEALIALLSR